MFAQLLPLLVFLKQAWRRLLIYKTLLLLNPSFVVKRLIWPPSQPRFLPDNIAAAGPSHLLHHDADADSTSAPPATTANMPPLPSTPALPRLVIYFQTHHHPDGTPISPLPLLRPPTRLTHLMLAAFHINADRAAPITLNDHAPTHASLAPLWRDVAALQRAGVAVLGMLGGAARGAFAPDTLDSPDPAVFARYYGALRDVVRARALDGLDLDVEEPCSLRGVVRLIDCLRADFGPAFVITLAPVAPALLDARRNLSGFDYEALEVLRGREIAFYNCQFYCGWGDCSNPMLYEMMLMKGWPPEKIVVGLVTNPANGSGFIPFDVLATVIPLMVGQHRRFGGIMGWEYFNSLPGGRERPWEWAQWMTSIMGADQATAPGVVMPVGSIEAPPPPVEEEEEKKQQQQRAVDVVDADEGTEEASLPGAFEYHTDGFDED